MSGMSKRGAIGGLRTVRHLALAGLAAVLLLSPVFGNPGAVEWREYSSALRESAQKKKLVLVYLYGEWCPSCKVMSRTTWSDPRVVAALEATVVPIRINVDSPRPVVACGPYGAIGAGNCASAYWEVQGVPAAVLLDSEGEYLYNETGMFDPDAMLAFLDLIKKETPSILLEVQAIRDSIERMSR